MKKGVSKILLVIVALLLGIVIGMLIINIFAKDNNNYISSVPNLEIEGQEKHIEINEANIINRQESTNDMTIVYESLGNDINSNLFADFITVEINNDNIKVIKKDKSDISTADGNIIETMHSPMGDGANGYIFFLTDKGSVYYVDVYNQDIAIEKIDSLSGVKNLVWVQASRVENIDPGDADTYIHRSARTTTLAMLENDKSCDLWEYVMEY